MFITELESDVVSLRMSAPKNENTVHDLLTLVQMANRSFLVLKSFLELHCKTALQAFTEATEVDGGYNQKSLA